MACCAACVGCSSLGEGCGVEDRERIETAADVIGRDSIEIGDYQVYAGDISGLQGVSMVFNARFENVELGIGLWSVNTS